MTLLCKCGHIVYSHKYWQAFGKDDVISKHTECLDEDCNCKEFCE